MKQRAIMAGSQKIPPMIPHVHPFLFFLAASSPMIVPKIAHVTSIVTSCMSLSPFPRTMYYLVPYKTPMDSKVRYFEYYGQDWRKKQEKCRRGR